MKDEMMLALATDVIKRLYRNDYTILTEEAIRVHMPIILTRTSGNQIAAFLAQLRMCASVEMFVNRETGETLSIVVLVARTRKAHRRELMRLEEAFVAQFSADTEVTLNRQQTIVEH